MLVVMILCSLSYFKEAVDDRNIAACITGGQLHTQHVQFGQECQVLFKVTQQSCATGWGWVGRV